ncbi:kelch repeat and BTB domain-containing protein 2-like [Stegodyphus dumicola]|uniref:kelch repeat and BTB domain-containing protein 2-like n=1 Tax=Stegodyphus dumicola TaxID=202533 RepID=UPI0015A865BE|nr:kelch repeat and BTB domain-containing protein 2-like [Stegodyphus dumicola]
MHKNKSSTSLPTISSSMRQGASNKHAQMLKQFNEDIFKRNVLTDVEVFVKGKVFRSHRSLLICFSPYLRQKLISSEGRPITNKVEIPLIDSNEFDVLLRYMYTGNLHIDCNIFLRVYQAASLLEMQDVMQECLQLLESENDMQTYFYVYMISKQMGIHSNWLRAFRLITHRFEECVFATEFMLLKVEYAIEILSAQTIGARSEVIVFLAGLNWLNYDYTSRCTYAVKIMECVRFSSMTMEEIVACYHPPFLPQVVEIPEIVELLFRANCYITAKALGQESWFKQYSNPKRMLAFENLSMELWHQKSPSSTPNLSVYCEEMNNMEDSLYLNTDINRTSDSITVSQADGNRGSENYFSQPNLE